MEAKWVQMIQDFIDDRPTIKQNNQQPGRVAFLLKEEVDEFLEEPNLERKAREAADIVWFLFSWAYMEGIDLEAEIIEKSARNIVKRPAVLYTNGQTYDEAEQQVRLEWTAMRENEFYEPFKKGENNV